MDNLELADDIEAWTKGDNTEAGMRVWLIAHAPQIIAALRDVERAKALLRECRERVVNEASLDALDDSPNGDAADFLAKIDAFLAPESTESRT